MRTLMKAYSKVRPKLHPLLSSVGGGPPVTDKLLAWLPGTNATTSTKLDSINSYNFTFQNCPPDYLFDVNGTLELDINGDPIWILNLIAGWECEYLAPAVGEPGHTELVAADGGLVLYDASGNPLANTKAALYAAQNDQLFFCENAGKGIAFYSEVLVGDELQAVNDWKGSCVVNNERDTWLLEDDGVTPLYTDEGEILTEE